jgi:predicted PP-loop superfamily ATPase
VFHSTPAATKVILSNLHTMLESSCYLVFAHIAAEAKDVVAQLAQSHGFAARDRSHMRSAVLLKCFRCSELLQGRF